MTHLHSLNHSDLPRTQEFQEEGQEEFQEEFQELFEV